MSWSVNNRIQQAFRDVAAGGDRITFSLVTDKKFKRIKGIYVSVPEEGKTVGSTLGLIVGQEVIFENGHEIRLLSAGPMVAPNQKFFLFDNMVAAEGNEARMTYTDGAGNPYLYNNGMGDTNEAYGGAVANPFGVAYPYTVRVYLWLTNEDLVRK